MRRLSPLLLLVLAACAAPGYRGLWTPKPVELLVTGADGEPAARLLAAVLGEWRGGEHDREIHVRVSLENIGAEPLHLPLERVELHAGDLVAFAPPYVVGGDAPAQVDPGGSAVLDLAFVPPAEGADLRGLHLRWVLLLGERELPGSVTLQRVVQTLAPHWHGGVHGWYPYGSPYWHGAWHDGWVGYGPAPLQALAPHVTTLPAKP
jgi:hypothetical protein